MKAWVLENVGNFNLTDIDQPGLQENEVLIQVQAAGICGSDIPRIYKTGAHQMPLVLGHEFSGKVVSVGSDACRRWLGKRVGVFPLIPCKQCVYCRQGKYELCSHYSYLGSRTNGGFAEYVAVPAWNLIELPDAVSFSQAAFLEPLSVAVHAFRRMNVEPTETVAVYGLGTIGMLLASLLLQSGIEHLLVFGNKDIQRMKALELGIPEDNFCDTRTECVPDWCSDRTKQRGVDVVFECVGENETCSDAIRIAASEGRICLVGNPMTDMLFERDVYWRILRNQLRLSGTWNSSFAGGESSESEKDDWHYALDCIARGDIQPELLITHRLPLAKLGNGITMIRDKTGDYIKVMYMRDL